MDLDELLARLASWAAKREDVRALALVGSRARGSAPDDSDVDIVLLTEDPSVFTEGEEWARELGVRSAVRTRGWGAITERRFALAGWEVDLGVGEPSWAAADPVDAGTRHVVRGGIRVLHDPDGLLARLVVAQPPSG